MELVYWGRIKKNVFWGRRSGSKHKDGTNQFKTKKWANGSMHSGPHGLQVRFRNVRVK